VRLKASVPTSWKKSKTSCLFVLSRARKPEDLGLPGFHLHPLKGDMKGLWAVTVRANWRVTFRFKEGEACDVDLVDYH
jgi:proteic killer suppression protein